MSLLTSSPTADLFLAFAAERNLNGTADPEFAVRVAAIKHRPGFEPVPDAALGGRVTEPRLDRIVDLPHVSRIINALIRIEHNIAAGNRLQMTVTDIQFPALNLLEEANRGHVLVVAGRSVPTVKAVEI